MQKYLETLINEKGIDAEMLLEIEGESGTNLMPLQIVIDAIATTSSQEQNAIKTMLVKIDFKNGDVVHYFRHLAQALAI